MNITFLIGNGFDIRMGMNSSYRALEEYYVGLPSDSEVISSFKEEITSDMKNWSDFERRIGEYTSSFPENKQEDFNECIDDFLNTLVTYLENEENHIDTELCEDEIKQTFFDSVANFYAELPLRNRNDLSSIISGQNEGVKINFVSFNYTHLLEKCIDCAFKEKNEIGQHRFSNNNWKHLVNRNIIHIHGQLPGPIILGVDNEKQINNDAWGKDNRFCQGIIKPQTNYRAGNLIDEQFRDLIENSSIICTFGMSLGETDKTWWKKIATWLKGSNRRLIIYAHNQDLEPIIRSPRIQFATENEILDHFFRVADVSESDRSGMEQKIYIMINSKLFNINLVELTKKKRVEELDDVLVPQPAVNG